MKSLELTQAQADILSEYLDRALAELGREIRGTDRFEYRQTLKLERDLLRGILVQLDGAREEAA